MGNSCSPGCAGGVFDGFSLCCPFPTRLDEIWDLIESVCGGFLTYPNRKKRELIPF